MPIPAGCEESAEDYGQCQLSAACAGICPAGVATGCNAGPADETAWGTDCVATATGPCAIEQLALAVCGGDSPTYQCHATAEQAFPAGCEPEADAFFACLAAR